MGSAKVKLWSENLWADFSFPTYELLEALWMAGKCIVSIRSCLGLSGPDRAMQPPMCDAIRIAHPQIGSDAKKFFFSASDAKTHSLDLKSQENARKNARENPAMLACDAKNQSVF